MEAVVPPLGVCGCSSGRSPGSPLFRICFFTVTRSGLPGKKGCTSTAWWTCPVEAVAKGIGLKFVNEGPKEEAIALWDTEELS